jgi:hypothetical protein
MLYIYIYIYTYIYTHLHSTEQCPCVHQHHLCMLHIHTYTSRNPHTYRVFFFALKSLTTSYFSCIISHIHTYIHAYIPQEIPTHIVCFSLHWNHSKHHIFHVSYHTYIEITLLPKHHVLLSYCYSHNNWGSVSGFSTISSSKLASKTVWKLFRGPQLLWEWQYSHSHIDWGSVSGFAAVRFSTSNRNLVLWTVTSCFVTLNCYGNISMTQLKSRQYTTYICIYVYMYICTYIYIYIYILLSGEYTIDIDTSYHMTHSSLIHHIIWLIVHWYIISYDSQFKAMPK